MLDSAALPVDGVIPFDNTVEHKARQSTGFVELDGHGRIPFKDALFDRPLEIREADWKNAKCEDPRNCVAACAVRRTFGKKLIEVVVFKTMLHAVFCDEDGTVRSERYAIRGALAKAIRHFDKNRLADGSGVWNLPPGIYMLNAPSGSAARGGRKNRRAKYGGNGGKQQMGEKIMQAHTRRLLGRNANANVETLHESIASAAE